MGNLTKRQAYEAVEQADINQYDWVYEIIESLQDERLKGYMEAKVEQLTDSLDSSTEDFREEVLEILSE